MEIKLEAQLSLCVDNIFACASERSIEHPSRNNLPNGASDLDICSEAVGRVFRGLEAVENLLQEVLKEVVWHMGHEVSNGSSGTLTQGRARVAQKGKEGVGGLLLKIDCGENISESEKDLAKNVERIHLGIIA